MFQSHTLLLTLQISKQTYQNNSQNNNNTISPY
jgi:hypothetical protein